MSVNKMERHEIDRVEWRNCCLAVLRLLVPEDSWDGYELDSAAFKQAVAEPIVELGDGFDFISGLLDVVFDTHKLDLSG